MLTSLHPVIQSKYATCTHSTPHHLLWFPFFIPSSFMSGGREETTAAAEFSAFCYQGWRHPMALYPVEIRTRCCALSTAKPECRGCRYPWHHSLAANLLFPFSRPTFQPPHLPPRIWVVCTSSPKPLISISNTYERGYEVNGLPWLTSFNVTWRWFSHIISFYLLFLNLVAHAQDYPASPTYACEDTSSYYSHVKNLRGEALKKKLNSIVAPHHSLSYKEVWDALKFLDAANVDEPDASSGVVEIYSLRVVSKRLSGRPQGWNREHLWPRSYGLTNGPSLTDLHNIRPADANVNASRGNKYYGECEAKSSKCLKPANKEAALDTETDKERWAPPRQVRGDIARALMYMEVSYGVQQSGRTPGLRLSDAPNTEKKEMGLLSTLLKWNEVDPPSREERLRNERICKFYQHNRNPFVDHPEYAKLIWNQPLSTAPPNTTINISVPSK